MTQTKKKWWKVTSIIHVCVVLGTRFRSLSRQTIWSIELAYDFKLRWFKRKSCSPTWDKDSSCWLLSLTWSHINCVCCHVIIWCQDMHLWILDNFRIRALFWTIFVSILTISKSKFQWWHLIVKLISSWYVFKLLLAIGPLLSVNGKWYTWVFNSIPMNWSVK